MLLSRYKKWKKKGAIDPEVIITNAVPVRAAAAALSRFSRSTPARGALTLLSPCAAQVSSVRIVFIRHGESEWNDVFNKGLGPVRPPLYDSCTVCLLGRLTLQRCAGLPRAPCDGAGSRDVAAHPA